MCAMFPRALLLGLLLAPELLPQSLSPELPPGTLLLSRIKARVKQQFRHMPKYTCLETFERFHKAAGPKQVQKQADTVRVEVLFANDKEFFDSPGGHDFRESDPSRFIASGMIGNGMFASHVQSIFVDDNGLFQYAGEEDLNGRRAALFNFQVPILQSGYVIAVPGARASVAMAGRFWADPATYDLIRIEIGAAQIPAVLQIASVVTTVDYAQTRIGVEDTLLARAGSLKMLRESGEEAYDRFEFTNCRAYQSDSTISFDEPPSDTPVVSVNTTAAPAPSNAAAAKPQAVTAPLPAGLSVVIGLTSPLTDRAAVGELVEGKIVGNVPARGAIMIPNGALVHGRLRRMDRGTDGGGYYSIGLEFTEIDAAGTRLRFFADLVSVSASQGIDRTLLTKDVTEKALLGDGGSMQTRTTERVSVQDPPGVGSFFMRGTHFELPAGFRMVWKTRAM